MIETEYILGGFLALLLVVTYILGRKRFAKKEARLLEKETIAAKEITPEPIIASEIEPRLKLS
ncbi:MAG: hypothetical protein Q9M50_09510 [Methylococcales bacterium]|nr:hypothetical protein [Methylococcales bacterium]